MNRDPWNRCYHCGKFIAYADFESGKVVWVDEWVTNLSIRMDPPERFPVHVGCKDELDRPKAHPEAAQADPG